MGRSLVYYRSILSLQYNTVPFHQPSFVNTKYSTFKKIIYHLSIITAILKLIHANFFYWSIFPKYTSSNYLNLCQYNRLYYQIQISSLIHKFSEGFQCIRDISCFIHIFTFICNTSFFIKLFANIQNGLSSLITSFTLPYNLSFSH